MPHISQFWFLKKKFRSSTEKATFFVFFRSPRRNDYESGFNEQRNRGRPDPLLQQATRRKPRGVSAKAAPSPTDSGYLFLFFFFFGFVILTILGFFEKKF